MNKTENDFSEIHNVNKFNILEFEQILKRS